MRTHLDADNSMAGLLSCTKASPSSLLAPGISASATVVLDLRAFEENRGTGETNIHAVVHVTTEDEILQLPVRGSIVTRA